MITRNPWTGRLEPFEVRRLDTNPANRYTFGTWVLVSTFPTAELAEDYKRRAEGPTQQLRVQEVQS